MTRCMMTIDEALDLVLYAFDAGSSGDIFIKKVPAATLLTVVDALKEIFDAKNPVQIIGTRHGEKLYETLITCEEMSKAEDCGDYYRIPMDTRDMNYALYFSEGKEYSNTAYTSQNARRMSKEEMVNLLKTLDCVQEVLKGRD